MSHVPLPHRIALLLLAFVVASPVVDRPSASLAPDPVRIADSIFLGQAYPSGSVYLEGFQEEGRVLERSGWPDRIRFRPLDEGAFDPSTGGSETFATFDSIEEWVNPPVVEGMLTTDSPCVPPGYERRADSEYAGIGRDDVQMWDEREFYATSEWFGCAVEPTMPRYRAEDTMPRSFRIIAFSAELGVGGLDRGSAGMPRTMTAGEVERLEARRPRDCTLEPRELDEAREHLRLTIEGTPYQARVSSYVSACTSLAEVFLLDILQGGEIVTSRRLTRWRGNP